MPYKQPGDQTLKVLFADESKTMQKVAELTFQTDGYEIILSSGKDILNDVKRNKPQVVIIDVNLTGMDGYQACKILRNDAATNNIPVLLMSGPSTPYNDSKGSESGASDHIDKPFETQTMYEKVKALLLSAPVQFAAPPKPSEKSTGASSKPLPAIPNLNKGTAPRSKLGSKTVLGLGNMGFAPKPGQQPLKNYPRKAPGLTSPLPKRPGGITDSQQLTAKAKQSRGITDSQQLATKAKRPGATTDSQQFATQNKRTGGLPMSQQSPMASQKRSPIGEKQISLKSSQSKSAKNVGQLLDVSPQAQKIGAPLVTETNKSQKPAQLDGLTPEQVEAVRAISKEIIEQIVWEVVPDLAETIIKEKLSKLLQE